LINLGLDQLDKLINQLHAKKVFNFSSLYILVKDKKAFKNRICSLYNVIEAAGGVVLNQENKILWIYRLGKWDLPKGKLEPAETIEVCAQREIEEETGATHLSLQHKLMNTYHVYHLNGRDILKISHWYYFRCEEQYDLTPQLEEDITKIMWFNKKDVSIPMSNTFGTIRNLIEVFINKK